MPHDPTKTNEDRRPIFLDEDYDLIEFARKYDLTIGQAAAVIEKYGYSRFKLDEVMNIGGTNGR